MQPTAIKRDMPQTVNMINSACDSDNSGWGPNYPSSNNSGVPAGDIQNRKAVSSKENVDRETSPVTEYISEHLSQGKKDSPRDTVLSIEKCLAGSTHVEASQDLKMAPQVIKIQRSLLEIPKPAIIQGGRSLREFHDVTSRLGDLGLGGEKHKLMQNCQSNKICVFRPNHQTWSPYPPPPPLRRNHNSTHPPGPHGLGILARKVNCQSCCF